MKQAIYPKRTQISLSVELKNLIQARGLILKESLSEYLRKAALIRMALEDVERKDLHLIAKSVVGSVDRKKSGWHDVKSASSWQRGIRRDENSHRS